VYTLVILYFKVGVLVLVLLMLMRWS